MDAQFTGANRSEHTQWQYVGSVDQFARYLAEHGLPMDVRARPLP
jgi:hypothetical protein